MPTDFPTSLDTVTRFPVLTASTNRAAGGNITHSTYHGNLNDAIKAIQAKVGIIDSTVATSYENLFRYDVKSRRPLTGISSDSDEFDGTSLDGAWSWVRQGDATASVARGSLLLTNPYTSGGIDMPLLVRNIPSGSAWRVETEINYINEADGYQGGGLIVYESSSDKIVAFNGYHSLNSAIIYSCIINYWTGTSNNGDLFVGSMYGFQNPLYLAIELSGGNLFYEFSRTGLNGTWHRVLTEAVGTRFTTAPDKIGFVFPKFTGTTSNPIFYPRLSIPYIRRVS
jgi:hypothetical protein